MKKILSQIILALLLPCVAFCYGEFDLDCVPDGVISAGKTSDPTFLAGFVDVTWYGADPTGVNDSTTAINTAIVEARSCNYNVFFPHQSNGSRGRYKITDTINRRFKYDCSWKDGCQSAYLVGDRSVSGLRPEIFLADNTAGFTDAANPKPMVRYWAQDSGTGDEDWTLNDGDQNFDSVFIGIDITTGNNAGAIGIEIPGAQRSIVYNAHINATGGFSCMGNIGVLGQTTANVVLEGGQYAVYCDTSDYGAEGQTAGAGTPFVGITFKNQTGALFEVSSSDWASTIVLVGCYIKNSNSNIPFNIGQPRQSAGFVIIDSVIDLNNTTTTFLDRDSDTNTLVRNTYIKGCQTLVDSFTFSNTVDWAWVKYYSNDGTGTGDWSARTNVINGVEQDDTIFQYKEEGKTYSLEELENSLLKKHIWDEWSFPDWQDADIHNVKDLGVYGDDTHDDTVALQSAIDTYEKLFLPRGKYLISNTLTLRANTKIIGAGNNITVIKPKQSWQPDVSSPTIMVDTVDAAESTAVFAEIKIGHSMVDKDGDRVIDTWTDSDGFTWTDQFQFQQLRWRLGEGSKLLHITITKNRPWLDQSQQYKKFNSVEITGNGGGRWWAPVVGIRSCASDTHPLYYHDTTGQALRLYSWNDANCNGLLFENGSNVFLYGPSHEVTRWVRLDNMSNFFILGSHGNSAGPSDDNYAIYMIENSSNYELQCRENLYFFDPGENVVREVYGGGIVKVEEENLARFIRGEAEYLTITEQEATAEATLSGGSITGGSIK